MQLLDPPNHLHIHTCAFQAEEDKKNLSRMQTLTDNLQLKVQSYKQQIETVVSTQDSCSRVDFPAFFFFFFFLLMEICGSKLEEQLIREDQLSLKSAHPLVFLKVELSLMVKICAAFPSREPECSSSTLGLHPNMCLARNEPSKSMESCRDGKLLVG